MNENIKSAKRAYEVVESVLKAVDEKLTTVKKASGVDSSELSWAMNNIKIIVDFYCDLNLPTEEISDEDRYVPVNEIDWSRSIDQSLRAEEENWQRLEEIDARCREKGTLLGRYFAIPVADSQAVYQIVASHGEKVFVERCAHINEGYLDLVIGTCDWLSKSSPEALITARDKVETVLKKNKEEFKKKVAKETLR